MKTVVLPSLLFGVGLVVGWLVKPVPEPVKLTMGRPGVPRVELPEPVPEESGEAARLAPMVPEQQDPAVPTETMLKLGAHADTNGKLRDEAKLKRLVEALGLTEEQTASLLVLIEKSQEAPESEEGGLFPGPDEMLSKLKERGAALDASLKALFTPEQQLAFGELRKRLEENRAASRAGRELAEVQDMVDLTEEQRERLGEQLAEEARATALSDEVALMLESSPLPLGPGSMNAEAVESLQSMVGAPKSDDPRVAHLELIQFQRRELDEKVERLRGILTPAQLLRYEAEQADQRFLLDQMAPPTP